MRIKRLGHTGLKVSEICLGTMTFGSQADEDTSRAIVQRALDAGVNFFDTANVYNAGRSEEITGRILKDVRRDIVLATKVHHRMGPGPNDAGQSRKHIMDAVEASLRRLGTDYIDLYQVHRFDPETPLEETLSALDDLVRAGKVRYAGCSNYAAWQLTKALWISDVRRLTRYDSVQPRYNLISRTIEGELLPLCADQGVGVIVYNPLGGGMLTGKHRREAGPAAGTRFDNNRNYQNRYWRDIVFDAVDRFREIAADQPATMAQLALAWTLANPVVTSAILGATSVQQLEETLPATEVTLSPELLPLVDELWEIVGRQEF
ncbi:MAG: aldo/keto reductase [Chloroflexi bacterium]|nr:aldo/keto reductase [Chloroflexota bacterium]